MAKRVVLHLKDRKKMDLDEMITTQNILHKKAAKNASSYNTGVIKLLDRTSILLTRKSTWIMPSQPRVHQFDHIANVIDPNAILDFTELMDQLVIHKRDCCLMQFHEFREFNLPFLATFFKELEGRMQRQHNTLHSILFEFHDVLNSAGDSNYPVMWLMQNDIKSGRFRQRFNNCDQLLKWMYGSYEVYWCTMQHVRLNIVLTFSDKRRRSHKVKLSLLQIFHYALDDRTRSALSKFLVNVESVKPNKNPSKFSTLLDNIAEFLHSKNYHSCLIFNLSLLRRKEIFVDGLFELATAAYTGLHKVRLKKLKTGSVDTIKSEQPTTPLRRNSRKLDSESVIGLP